MSCELSIEGTDRKEMEAEPVPRKCKKLYTRSTAPFKKSMSTPFCLACRGPIATKAQGSKICSPGSDEGRWGGSSGPVSISAQTDQLALIQSEYELVLGLVRQTGA